MTSALLTGGRLNFRGASMLDLISIAYGFESERVIGGPGWLNTDRFDIAAKAAASTPDDALRTMLQALLAERFNLAVRTDEKPMPVYALTVGKRGAKLKESIGDGPLTCKRSGGGVELVTITCQRMTMQRLTSQIRGMGALEHPVIDQTGLTGAYDIALSASAPGMARKASGDADQASGVSIFEAVDQQLGLKLEAQSQRMAVIVVEHVNQKPTPNPPGTAPILPAPPAPTEFEVADVRVSKPGTTDGPFRFLRSGQLEMPGTTLKRLVTLAYDVEPDRVVNTPKWWDSEHYDIIAKTTAMVPMETLRVLLQSLLKDRFQLEVHNDEQPVTVYALTLGKREPKLKDADNSNRSDCKVSIADGLGTYTCQNTTMAQFAVKLRETAGGYLADHPVVDLTGLTGSYDFALTWAPAARFAMAGRGGGDAGTAAAPTGDITVFEAVDKYLGLKLAAQKHPMPVIVIDRVERTPTDN
jgi:uncharacterized protein (TIGR03435 family)